MLPLGYYVYLLLLNRLEKKREYLKQWYLRHPGYASKNAARWNKTHPERRKKTAREWAKKWRAENPGVAAKRRKEWVEKNPEKNAEQAARYRSNHKKENCEWAKAYRLTHPDAVRKLNRASKRRRYLRDPLYRAVLSMRTRIRHALSGINKSAKSLELLGCSAEELRQHLEKQFQPGMTWENYGVAGWHIDHVKPCAKFDLTDPAQQKQCFHYTNLQPLWALDNIKKGDTYGRG